jgi:hypothetical protein
MDDLTIATASGIHIRNEANFQIRLCVRSDEPTESSSPKVKTEAVKTLLAGLFLSALSFGQATTIQDAGALEAQYGTCAKHYIPAEKCTPEIYQQLRAKDEAPPDAKTAAALSALKEYRSRLKNPDSLQVHTAYVTDEGAVCLEVAGQNGMGGMSLSRVVYLTESWPHRSKGHWLDEGGMGGAAAARISGNYQVDRWGGICTRGAFHPKLVPGTDMTAKVNQALKRVKDSDELSDASQPVSPTVQHEAPIADPEAHDAAKPQTSTSRSFTHGTIGASSDGNPKVRHDGVTVSQIVSGGPADQVGIKVGDVILAINDHYLFTSEELNNAIDGCKPGSTIRIRYRRDSMTYETSLIVSNREAAKTEN